MNTSEINSNVKIKILGSGDAFSSSYGSSAYFFWNNDSPDNGILFDCGYQTPASLFRENGLHKQITTIIISHFHADHFFGLPILLSYWILREPRKKPLTILAPSGAKEKILALTEEAYPGVWEKKDFDITFETIGRTHHLQNFSLEFGLTQHSIESWAIKIQNKDTCFAFSGDGAATAESLKLFEGASLLIHETYGLEGTNATHEYLIPLLNKLSRLKSLKQLLLTHMKEDEREKSLSHLERVRDHYHFNIKLLSQNELLSVN